MCLGRGEYGITDILYAGARSKNTEVFRFLFEFAMNVVRSNEGGNEGSGTSVDNRLWEMMNRAVHAAARGGNLEVLKELLLDCSDVLEYRDAEGSTILHSAASRGQLEVAKDLIATYNHIVGSTDNQGNTALHIAAYRGYSSTVEALVHASPSLGISTNNDGDTFLHFAVAGFRFPGFHRIDQQLNLMKDLVSGKTISLKDIVNMRNNKGRTVLHIAVVENSQLHVVQLLMSVPSLDLNVCDVDGFTPLDLLKRCPRTATSEILIRQITSAGGISTWQDDDDRNPLVGHLGARGIGTSPGTSFRFLDAEFCSGHCEDNDSQVSCEPPSSRFSSCSSEPTSHLGSPGGLDLSGSKKRNGSGRFKLLPHWPRKVDRKLDTMKSFKEEGRNIKDIPTPLREKFSRASSLRSNKGSFPLKGEFASPSAKERFTASLMHGVIQATPPKSCFSSGRFSPWSPFSKSSTSSPSVREKLGRDHRETDNVARSSFFSGPLNGGKSQGGDKHRMVGSFNKSLMNRYLCFGAQGLVVEDSVANRPGDRRCRRLVF